MRSNLGLFGVSALLIGAALALVVSPFASSSPDGLESVAERQGFASSAEASSVDTPFADYGIEGAGDGRMTTGISGLIGTLLTFGIGTGLFALLRLLRPAPAIEPSPPAPAGT